MRDSERLLDWAIRGLVRGAIGGAKTTARATASLMPVPSTTGTAFGCALAAGAGWLGLFVLLGAALGHAGGAEVGAAIGLVVGGVVGWGVGERGFAAVRAANGGISLGQTPGRFGVQKAHIINRQTRVRHVSVFGATGSGKSTAIKNLVSQDFAAPGRPGVMVVDIKDDLVLDIARRVPPERLGDVVLFDPTDTAFPPALNPFAGVRPEGRTLAAAELIAAFERLYQGDEIQGLANGRACVYHFVRTLMRCHMRGEQDRQVAMLVGVVADDLVPQDHPIRAIRRLVDGALRELSPLFDQMYAADGRRSIPPEHLLKSLILIALYSIRSERQFCERLQYDLLFKWFLDLNISDAAFDPSTFSKNRERLLKHDAIGSFFAAVLGEARRRRLLSSDHFTVDGTLLEAWASLKSFKPKAPAADAASASTTDEVPLLPPASGGNSGGRNPEVDFHGEKRSNKTHQSTTDPEARLAKKGKGKEAKLSFLGNVLMENRHGLVVDVETVQASGTGEVEAALRMLDRVGGERQLTVGGDKNYDQHPFVDACRTMGVTPHVAQKQHSTVDGRTTRHTGYATSQKLRKRVEEIFGWEKTVGGCRKLRYRGLKRVAQWFTLAASAFNLVRMANLERKPTAA